MPPADRRQREREATRQKILDAARELFLLRGYEAVTMREVARKVEYTAPALYTHFKDKDTLVRALCDADFLALGQVFAKLARVADPVERIRKAGLAYVDFAMKNPNHYRFMFMTVHVDPDPADSAVEHGNPDQDAYAFLRGAVVECLESGCFRDPKADPDMIAQAFWSGMHGLVSLHLTKGNDPWIRWRPVKRTAELICDAMLRGLLKEA